MRMALYADPTFEQGLGGKAGLAAARSIALISYRSFEGYNTTQFESDEDCMFPQRAASYQRYQGKKLVDRFDAYSYLSMLNLTDSHNVGRKRGGVEKALGMVKANTVCIGIDSDGLFPVEEQKFMAEHIPGARYREITSAFGHDGFLLEWKQIKEIIEIEGLI
jgi:homoserine O-acetyltransferase